MSAGSPSSRSWCAWPYQFQQRSQFACCAMESVFHEVPCAAGYKTWDKNKLDGQVHSRFEAAGGLLMADLRNKALRKLVVKRMPDRIGKEQCPVKRRWAEVIHAQCVQVQGLCRISR